MDGHEGKVGFTWCYFPHFTHLHTFTVHLCLLAYFLMIARYIQLDLDLENTCRSTEQAHIYIYISTGPISYVVAMVWNEPVDLGEICRRRNESTRLLLDSNVLYMYMYF